MVDYVPIDSIKPADYNPRIITKEQMKELKKSIQSLGIVIPIIVNKKNNVIIAGHQRTEASKKLGIKTVPVFYVDNLMISDEIKFNQIHNAQDRKEDLPSEILEDVEKEKFIEVNNKSFHIGGSSAMFVKEICKILTRYGNVLSCVCCMGKVIVGENYIKACQLMDMPVNTYVIADDKMKYSFYLNAKYGEYSYKNIKRNTYVQGLAQLTRNRKSHRLLKSTLYEHHVLPYLHKTNKSILDFGCGKGEYIEAIKDRRAVGIEFYNNNLKSIDIAKGNKMINNLINSLHAEGLFDVVVCDSVLNSVDSKQAEQSVIKCCNVFLKNGGKLFISGRPIEGVFNKYDLKKAKNIGKRFIEFLDSDNFSGNLREGNWYFQHWHSKEDIKELLEQNGFIIEKIDWMKNGDSFQVIANKIKELGKDEIESAIDFEFNLPLPNNRTYQRQKDVMEVVRNVYRETFD